MIQGQMTQEDIAEANNRVKEVFGESFLTEPLEVIIAKTYDLACSDTGESFEIWYQRRKEEELYG